MGQHCHYSMGISLAKEIFAWHDLVIFSSCDQQHQLPRGATLLRSLAGMQHKKSLTNAFIVMVVTDRPASTQVLWHLIVMGRDHDWWD
jgi:hypothetical protein